MKKLIFVILTGFFCNICDAQIPQKNIILKQNWNRIYIKNLGNFDLPPTMEIQQGKYKEYIDNLKKIKGFDTSQLTAQQKGLNKFKKKGFEKYARVIIETTFGSIGDFEKLNFNIATYTQADISELNLTYKKQIQQSFIGSGLKLIEWYPIKIKKINNMSCIHMSYKRQLEDKPFVLVNIYQFHNNDRMHTFILSYRVSESTEWKPTFENILKSYRITNIK
ncbi:TPA: hypothetical protein ACT5CJ_002303 [Flavobacterium psychrophilum]